ncbi:ATP-binding cassette transporter G2 [Salpingoeca rosetta]|uniref:ATP-binding cassette transporter G2 n=1 Tax=Salpingoeca rosetta (strain ATCC 50818 / BSB-021) TaxID=946362 RepID=F2USZ4_SALR5|nr:ATP-binding cassette transporter G2 [Salpingoeca rosetta]EGD81253.1 ATP-binding cassette transporter G2 [Salpingoeca rosetta]|eukprot:XP_004987649.1 ATP-binding cassette transporter G2 [Salpingoeca rosetta]
MSSIVDVDEVVPTSPNAAAPSPQSTRSTQRGEECVVDFSFSPPTGASVVDDDGDDGDAVSNGVHGREATSLSDKQAQVKSKQQRVANKFFQGDPELVFDPRVLGTLADDAEQQSNGGSEHHRESQFALPETTRHPTVLQFSDVTYEVDVTKGEHKGVKQILKGLNGEVKPGQVLAIMGASGAGKTTLLNMLAGRLSAAGHGRSGGSILVNGQKRNFNTFRQISAYVLQQDCFFPTLTVRETITLSAMLRLPVHMSREAKLAQVDGVIAELGLTKCADTYVGNELIRGVSGGEKKRLNVGTELVTNPSLLFLDEPTTGLDSFNAQNVMQTLLTLAKSNRTIIATIHQPRSSIFQMFDLLMLLSEGCSMYFGPAADAVGYFGSIGYECPEEFNPADYFLDLISLDQRSPRAQRTTQKRIDYIGDRFLAYQQQHPVVTDVSDILTKQARQSELGGSAGKPPPKYTTSFGRQVALLTQRSIRATLRDKINNFSSLGQTLLFSIILGVIWLNEGDGISSNSVQAIAGALFFVVVNQSFGSIFGILFVFPVERVVVLKERASRSYHVGAYFWAKTVAELPRTFLLNLLFAVITYFMVGLRDGADHFFLFVVIVFCVSLTAEGLALIVSAIADDPQQAGAIAPAFIVTSMLFGGYFIGVNQIPSWLSWLSYLSFLKYGFAAIMINEFDGQPLDPSCAMSNNGTNSTAMDDGGPLCFAAGGDVLNYFNLDELSLGVNIVVLLAMAVGFRLIAYWILRVNGPVYDHSL